MNNVITYSTCVTRLSNDRLECVSQKTRPCSLHSFAEVAPSLLLLLFSHPRMLCHRWVFEETLFLAGVIHKPITENMYITGLPIRPKHLNSNMFNLNMFTICWTSINWLKLRALPRVPSITKLQSSPHGFVSRVVGWPYPPDDSGYPQTSQQFPSPAASASPCSGRSRTVGFRWWAPRGPRTTWPRPSGRRRGVQPTTSGAEWEENSHGPRSTVRPPASQIDESYVSWRKGQKAMNLPKVVMWVLEQNGHMSYGTKHGSSCYIFCDTTSSSEFWAQRLFKGSHAQKLRTCTNYIGVWSLAHAATRSSVLSCKSVSADSV